MQEDCYKDSTLIMQLLRDNLTVSGDLHLKYSRFSRDVTAAMLVYRTIAKKGFWEFDSIIMQNLSDILPLFCTPTWPSHHVSENQELQLILVLVFEMLQVAQ